MSLNRKTLIYDAALLITAMGIYAPTLWYGFIGDDLVYFVGNLVIRSFDISMILRYGATGADYLPLRDLSFAFDHFLWNDNPFGFHLTNVLLYCCTVVGVRRLFTGLNAYLDGGESDRHQLPAFFAALLFAIHPYHRGVVNAVFNRGALMTALFCILTCIFYLHAMRGAGYRRGAGAYLIALCSYVLALLSREYGIILPMLLTMIVLLGDRAMIRARIAWLMPFYFVGFVFYLIYRQYAAAAQFIAADETLFSGFADKVLTAFRIMAFYAVRMITTKGDMNVTDGLPFAALAVTGAVLVLAACIRMRRSHPQLLAGFLFYMIALLPVLNFYRTLPVLAIRYAYLPCLGLFFLLTAIPFEGWKKAVHVAVLGGGLLYTYTTSYQMQYYENNVKYWEFISSFEQNDMIYKQLGLAYYREHQYENALQTFNRISPAQRDSEYYTAIGDVCLNLGDYPCTVQALNLVLALGGGSRETLNLLARARQGLHGKAP